MPTPRYLLIFRETVDSPWEPFPFFSETIEEAQRKVVNYSRGSPYHFDILECRSVTDRFHDNIHVDSPDIVKERGTEVDLPFANGEASDGFGVDDVARGSTCQD